MNNLPGTFFFTEPLFLIPSVQTEVQESGPHQRCHTCFEGTTFPHARPAEPVRLDAAREIGFSRGPPHSFRGNHFSSFLPALRSVAQERQQIGSPGISARSFEGTTFPPFFRPRLAQLEARTLGWQETAAVFSREPLSLIPLGSRTPRWPQSLSSSSFSSPSLQGGSGIPAVPKTGASVLRLPPPTSGYGPREGSQGNGPPRRDAEPGADQSPSVLRT